MTTTELPTTIDRDTVARLGSALHRCAATFEAGPDLFTPDVWFDIHPPFWRFQLRGAEAFCAQQRSIAKGELEVTVVRTVPTATGFVMETEAVQRSESVETARHIWWCEVRDGRISQVAVYCNGAWDEQLRARHAVEAPMLQGVAR